MLISHLLWILGSLCRHIIAAEDVMCVDTVDDFFIKSDKSSMRKWTSCQWTEEDTLFDQHIKNAPLSPRSSLQSAPFDITFQCYDTPQIICGKAERAFKKTAEMISSIILFNEPVKVNATLMSFCKVGEECGKSLMTLGGSSPSRAMPLLNNDGMLRLHPQALVKQFGLPDHPAFSRFDILSVFNADAPFWFEEDGVPIDPSQADFSFVVLHEFMHGLGFYSGWNEYISAHALTPDPSPFLANQLILMVNPSTNALHPSQFLESAMDRLVRVIEIDKKSISIPISSFTKQLNRIQAKTITELVNSPDFGPAKQMAMFATTSSSLAIRLSKEEEIVILETGLQPFQPGSSISHVSYADYTHTPDFLMRFMQDRGLTLEDAIKRGGGNGPVGPLLLRIFEEIGYSTIQNSNTIPPLLIFQAQDMVEEEMVQNFTLRSKNGIRRKNHTEEADTSSSDISYELNLYYICFIITAHTLLLLLTK